MKLALVLIGVLACASCTTLENRRDLYRSPREGYEAWFPQPPPTRLPSSPPSASTTISTTAGAGNPHGVITFPEEPSLPAKGQ
ncbi:MAG: hypothetical protein M3Y80_07005 [Verrucomicrobiota bacterium]|nr:hypothetical protein [Verrucomicrobiota bacterium]